MKESYYIVIDEDIVSLYSRKNYKDVNKAIRRYNNKLPKGVKPTAELYAVCTFNDLESAERFMAYQYSDVEPENKYFFTIDETEEYNYDNRK